jgi:hypothetical protein
MVLMDKGVEVKKGIEEVNWRGGGLNLVCKLHPLTTYLDGVVCLQ